jgi:hypothetical protein
MSRAYNLRTRTGTGIATQSGQVPEEAQSRSNETDNWAMDSETAAPHVVGTVSNAEVMMAAVLRSYSDVVASRPPSPNRERPTLPTGIPTGNPGVVRVPEHPSVPNNEDVGDVSGGYATSGEVETNPDRADSHWTTVQRRRTRSLESIRNQRVKPLTAEQTRAVKKAAEGMTAEQKQHLQRRHEKVRPRRDSLSSHGEGPSNPKGKDIDPREWGNVNISPDSYDVGAQAAALNSWKNLHQQIQEICHS